MEANLGPEMGEAMNEVTAKLISAIEAGPRMALTEAKPGNDPSEQFARDLSTYHFFRDFAKASKIQDRKARAAIVAPAVRRMMRKKYLRGDYGENRRVYAMALLTVGAVYQDFPHRGRP